MKRRHCRYNVKDIADLCGHNSEDDACVDEESIEMNTEEESEEEGEEEEVHHDEEEMTDALLDGDELLDFVLMS